MPYLVTLLLSLALHLTLGWGWTLFAGVVAGVWVARGGWYVGALGVGAAWAVLVAYSYLVAAGPVGAMTEVMGGLLGNLPGIAFVALTLLAGVLLGALGGFIGTQFHLMVRRR